jgi:hypothetical protein
MKLRDIDCLHITVMVVGVLTFVFSFNILITFEMVLSSWFVGLIVVFIRRSIMKIKNKLTKHEKKQAV